MRWLRGWFLLGLVSAAQGLDFAGLQALVAGAPPGQVIVVPRGYYVGQLVVDRPVILRGEPGAVLVHEPDKPGPTLWIRAAGTRVEHLALDGSGLGTRRDHTAVVVSAPDVELHQVSVTRAWAGLLIEGDRCRVAGFRFVGLVDYPFWERGEGVMVTASGVQLEDLDLAATSDGILLEKTQGARVARVTVREARYGLHVMFGSHGSVVDLQTSRSVVGLMAMETTDWTIARSRFTEGYRVGSAGVRLIRTRAVVISGSQIARCAAGLELLDVRQGRIENNRIEENAVAWTWGGDNSGTEIRSNDHRGNLADASGSAAEARTLVPTQAHSHSGPAPPSPVAPSNQVVPPQFIENSWDAWKGLDLDGDGLGDTPYRFDGEAQVRSSARPWHGVFLGSPWSILSQTLPGGAVLDPRPRVD